MITHRSPVVDVLSATINGQPCDDADRIVGLLADGIDTMVAAYLDGTLPTSWTTGTVLECNIQFNGLLGFKWWINLDGTSIPHAKPLLYHSVPNTDGTLPPKGFLRSVDLSAVGALITRIHATAPPVRGSAFRVRVSTTALTGHERIALARIKETFAAA